MTRFDIRVRRKQFTQSRIESHKNYQSLLDKHYEQSRKKTRGLMVVVFLIIMLIAVLLAFFNKKEEPEKSNESEPVSELIIEKNIGTTITNKVYKL